MARILHVAAPTWAGVWHRFRVLNHAATFAKHRGYAINYFWAPSGGVSHCRYEELLAPIPRVAVANVPQQEIDEVEEANKKHSKNVRFRGKLLPLYRPGGQLQDEMIAFDLAANSALENSLPSALRFAGPLMATPSAEIRRNARGWMQRHDVGRRLGIRVRVTECAADGRKPRRIQSDLDLTVKSLVTIPWYVRTFVVTDSEYVQQMLASHFHDARFVPKQFNARDKGGRYVDRYDPSDMRNFLTEVDCLTACWKIVNVGGFLNQEAVYPKTIGPPYERSIGSLRQLLASGVARA